MANIGIDSCIILYFISLILKLFLITKWRIWEHLIDIYISSFFHCA